MALIIRNDLISLFRLTAIGAGESLIKPVNLDKVRAMFPHGTIVLSAPVADHMADLFASERKYVEAAVEKRKAEFSTGRILAARAMELLGIPRQPILKGEHNEPVWPKDIVGSITHTGEVCIVALANSSICSGIGIDVEKNDADVRNVSHLILRADERLCGYEPGDAMYDHSVRRIFSAKEAIFKAIFAKVNRFIDFDEVSVKLDADDWTFVGAFPDSEELDRLVKSGKGANASLGGFIVSAFYLQRSELE